MLAVTFWKIQPDIYIYIYLFMVEEAMSLTIGLDGS